MTFVIIRAIRGKNIEPRMTRCTRTNAWEKRVATNDPNVHKDIRDNSCNSWQKRVATNDNRG